MITKIEYIKKHGLFENFRWNNDIKEFSNLISFMDGIILARPHCQGYKDKDKDHFDVLVKICNEAHAIDENN